MLGCPLRRASPARGSPFLVFCARKLAPWIADPYTQAVRKAYVDQFAARRPFQPFEIRLVDGQRFRFTRIEQFLVGRTALGALTPSGDILLINMGLISTIRPLASNGKSPSGKSAGGS